MSIGGPILVVLEGTWPPTNRQLISVRRQFGYDDWLNVLKFY